jgi:hypothetical protein
MGFARGGSLRAEQALAEQPAALSLPFSRSRIEAGLSEAAAGLLSDLLSLTLEGVGLLGTGDRWGEGRQEENEGDELSGHGLPPGELGWISSKMMGYL